MTLQLRTGVGATPASISSTAVTSPAALSVGDLAWACIRTGSAISLSSISDSAGNTWTILSGVANGAGQDILAYSIITSAGTPTWTLTFNNTNSPQISFAAIYDDASATFTHDQDGTGNTGASGTAVSANSLTTTGRVALVGAFSMGANETYSASTGTIVSTANGTPTARVVQVYLNVASSGTNTLSVTGSASAAWIGQQLSFTVSGSAPSTPAIVLQKRIKDPWNTARIWAEMR